MNDKSFKALCKKIESEINFMYEYQWHKDNLSEYHQSFFSSYDTDDYLTVYHDGYYVSKEIQNILIETTCNICEIEIYFSDNLVDEIKKCTSKQLQTLNNEYNIHFTGLTALTYLPVNGFYAIIRNKDFNADIFNCGALPYDVQEV